MADRKQRGREEGSGDKIYPLKGCSQ
jgi:hypothetical protein